MAKQPKFMQRMIASNKEKSDRLRDKLGGESILKWDDPTLQWISGGILRGRLNLLWGPSGSGKSALALIAAGKEQQKSDGYVIIFDSEYAHKNPLDTDDKGEYTQDAKDAQLRMSQAGLDWQKVIVKSSNLIDTLFEDLEQIKEDLKDDASLISAIIVDSWGGIEGENAQKAIAKGELSRAGNQYGGNAKLTGPLLQELLRLAAENGVLCMFVQHCIAELNEYAALRYRMVGGERLRFLVHSSVFIESIHAKDANLLEGEVATTKETKTADIIYRTGKKIRGVCEKSRVVVEGRKGEFFLNFKDLRFALPEVSLFTLAEKLGIIAHPTTAILEDDGITPKLDKKTGEPIVKTNNLMWSYPVNSPNPGKWKGESGMIAALKDDKDLYARVYADCLKSGKTDAASNDLAEAEVEAAEIKKKPKK